MKSTFLPALLLSLLLLATPGAAFELPAGAARFTVDCPGDGETDCTDAIRDAFKGTYQAWEQIYLPPGTYLVSDRIDFGRFLTLRGAGPDKTVIKLDDGAGLFQDPDNPRAVVRAFRGCCEPGGAHDNTTHSNHLLNLTVDVGNNNPGAVGVDWISHNGGGIENVKIVCGTNSGVTGISLDRDANGPCLINNVKISGFDTGISIGWGVYGTTFEEITLENQRTVGFRNDQHPVSIRHLTSHNSVPAIISTSASYGMLVLLDSQLKGGAPGGQAIESTGAAYIRNVTAEGYASVLKNGSSVVDGMHIDEFTSSEIHQSLASPDRSLNLPIKDIYTPQYDPPEEWVSVTAYSAQKNGDDWGPAVQAAIDAGKSTVYFPSKTHGAYPIKSDIVIRGAVRTVIGMYANLEGATLRIETDDPGAVIYLEQVRVKTLEHRSPATVVLRRCLGKTVQTFPTSGDLFVDDWCCGNFVVDGSDVWVRQLNEESHGTKLRVTNNGRLWVLGLKTEQGSLIGHFDKGGAAEILGGLLYPAQGTTSDYAYFNDGGAFAAFHREVGAKYAHFLKETQNGTETTADPSFTEGTFFVSNTGSIGGDPTAAKMAPPGRRLAGSAVRNSVSVNASAITVYSEKAHTIRLVGADGRVIRQAASDGGHRVMIGRAGIAPGVYFVDIPGGETHRVLLRR